MTAAIYDRFAAQINVLEITAGVNSDATIGVNDTQRIWWIPESWNGDPLDIEGMAEPFDRTDMNDDYQGLFDDVDGKSGDGMAIKKQADHLSSQEQAFRLRHASAIRCSCHAANRLDGHGLEGAGIYSRLSGNVQDLVVSGSAEE